MAGEDGCGRKKKLNAEKTESAKGAESWVLKFELVRLVKLLGEVWRGC